MTEPPPLSVYEHNVIAEGISALTLVSWRIAEAKGWHSEPLTFPERLCLIHSEVSEALEAFRDPATKTEDLFRVQTDAKGKPIGIASELADIVIRVCDLAGIHGIDLENAILAKTAYNQTRSFRHGGKRL